MTATPNVIELSQQLIRCPSITPVEGGALTLLEKILTDLGFTCHRMTFSDEGTPDVENLYARLGSSGPNFCYAGHTDVVPVGDAAAWKVDPFGGEIIDGVLYGRGAVDMKGSIACFVTALAAFLNKRGRDLDGSISLLITGDEEDVSINGTRKVLRWMSARGETLDCCLVGEPTSNARLGDMIKIGRRGSMNGTLTVRGTQGHTAYPQLADNPVHSLVCMLHAISTEPLDGGSEHFPPTSLQITSVDVGNPVTNVIPADARAMFNVRFNDLYSSKGVLDWVRERLDRVGGRYDLDFKVSGESFLSKPGPFSDLVVSSVANVTQQTPELGTTGGTSDARFIKDFCPVAELGLLNDTAHKVDEQVPLSDLTQLEAIYGGILEGYFKA
ncbi:succinyl-diaminopimelate desuccinylase [Denitrobaculum tricleocarpae]|uniref:Succinyl-diaminopimelate desuccinylase n=1 Tax=Denitrobaculum tricleocarpae TaxID=2591009 RepID=A0A545U1B4_9PROT|nr:succinyl-diaminopimelate desuccinylase [Denitrobaculum tricleocarpae]TQV83271.1 succinyl-diaminopimelate desuccinylase [Denitrobaculum tricleocarpae]